MVAPGPRTHRRRIERERCVPVQDHVFAVTRSAGLAEEQINIDGLADLPHETFEVTAPVDGLVVPEPTRGAYPWPAAARDQRFHLAGPPPLAGLNIETAGLHEALGDMLDALRGSDEWVGFAAAAEALDDADREQLAELRRAFRAKTAPEVVDANAGGLLMARTEYADAALAEARGAATDRAAGYARAFTAVDRLIDRAMWVVSERVTYARPIALPPDTEVTWDRSDDRVLARASVADELDDFTHPGACSFIPASHRWAARGA